MGAEGSSEGPKSALPTIDVTGTYRPQNANPFLNLKTDGQRVPIDELQALVTAGGIKLPNGATLHGGTLGFSFLITGYVPVLTVAGPIELNDTRLVGFDLGSRIRGIAALSRIKTGDTTSIENLKATLHITTAGIEIDNIYARIPAMGEITGSGTVSSGSNLNFALTAKVTAAHGIGKVGAGLLTKLNKPADSGDSGPKVEGVPMQVTGTANEPIITADVHAAFDRRKNAILEHFGKKK
jgi:AsmA protein